MITLNLEQYFVWYYILIVIILSVTFTGSYIHRKKKGAVIPFLWGIILSLTLIIGAQYLEPLLFGFLAYWNIDWYSFLLFASFTAIWGIYVTLTLYNSVRYGRVVA